MAPNISLQEVMDRAQYWVDTKATYSQSDWVPDPRGKKYRTDCSGLCSMAYALDQSYTTRNFRTAEGIISLGSIHDLLPGDALLKTGHMELFVRWKNSNRHEDGAYVYSFNVPGETVRNPERSSNDGKPGFNPWSEMLTYSGIRYTKIVRSGPVTHPAPVPAARPVLSQGSSGPAVKELQQLLNARGAQPRLAEDADFGPKTKDAVIQFQRAAHIDVDGSVGPQTWGRLLG